MVTKFLNVSTDAQLSENSNTLVPSQKAVRNFIASKAIQLDFIQSVAPTTYTTGQKWLNTSDNKLYTAVSSSSWGTGVSVETDQFFTYLDLLYYFDGTNVKSYSTETITEQRAGAQLKTWLGTRAQYNALGGVYDSDTVYQVVESGSDYAILATQTEFNNGSTTRAATPYQVKQYSAGAYLALTGGNLSAGAVLRLTNSNNQVTELAYDTNGYLTVSTGLYVTNTADVNSVVVRGGTIYKTSSTSGVTAIWSDSIANTSTFGIVKPDGTSITINNGIISASGTGQLANTATGTNSLTILGTPTSAQYAVNVGKGSAVSNNMGVAVGYDATCQNAAVAVGGNSEAYSGSVAIGCYSKTSSTGAIAIGDAFQKGQTLASGANSIAIGSGDTYSGTTIASGANSICLGHGANSSASHAIQIGAGTNSTANTLSVGLDSSHNYQLLDSNGNIPDDRMPINADYVVAHQAPTSENNYTWKRVYKSGWIEQGGLVDRSNTDTVNLLVPMADTNYSILMFSKSGHAYAYQNTASSTTSFNFNSADDNTDNNTGIFYWEVKGYAAEESN